jgi:hypothetical protein
MVMLRTLQLLLNVQANHGRCRICGTRLCGDDTITVAGSDLTHAECFLVHLLEAPDHSRPGVIDSGADNETADVLRETLAHRSLRPSASTRGGRSASPDAQLRRQKFRALEAEGQPAPSGSGGQPDHHYRQADGAGGGEHVRGV